MLRNIILRALFSRKHGVIVSITNALLLEDNSYLLLEDGSRIELE